MSFEPSPDAFHPPGPDAERMVEALLFATAEPLSPEALRARLPQGCDVDGALERLAIRYAGRGVQLACVAGRFRFQTAPDLAFLMSEVRQEPRRLSRAGYEVLAIVAYQQPVTRAEIEAARGVALSKGTLDTLLEQGWVRMRGRRRSPGRPVAYGTTDAFLEHFGLASLADLPGAADLRAAGLLDLDLPAGFTLPDPSRECPPDLDPADDAPEFVQEFLEDAAEG